MMCLLVYDIPDNRVRGQVAEICLDYGLERIQYSAFMGELNRNRQGEILLKIRRKVGTCDANVLLVPVCEKDLRLQKRLVVNDYCLGQRGE